MNSVFFDRDLSWLSFNGRVLAEAARETVPLFERIRFLSIYSSNLDEFYRVRVPAMMALQRINKGDLSDSLIAEATNTINRQQEYFGYLLQKEILPELQKAGYHLLYNEPIPEQLHADTIEYFYTQVAGFLQPFLLSGKEDFFPENNLLYLTAAVQSTDGDEELYMINIPYNQVPRFWKVGQYIVFLEDVIKHNLSCLFPGKVVKGSWNLKITRDAELDLEDEYEEDIAEKIEKQLAKRDKGFATRFLYEPGIPLRHLQHIVDRFNLRKASVVEGGRHHNLKDLAALPLSGAGISYPAWPAASVRPDHSMRLLEQLSEGDLMIHAPYQSYSTVLRFFNEAAIDPSVKEVYTTLYRVASDSRIAQALISAAKNGKAVTVLVELKARFDEANNIRWAKKMKAAGVKIIYSINALKVHAKIALIKREHPTHPYAGLLATGNLNESTARFYTDHILLTAFQPMLQEMELLFGFLSKRKKPDAADQIPFKHLLVAQFNLQSAFLGLIDREILHAKQGRPASILIKMNNLEEEVMIRKLYEASNAGVEVRLIVRGICRLVPGIEGQSSNISVKRIVDRYLEHGRVFVFHNDGQPELFLGSADWMNRNIYRRIEVCFPVYDPALKEQFLHIVSLQWQDNVQAVWIDATQSNKPVKDDQPPVRSQEAIYQWLSDQTQTVLPEKMEA
ncbi:polyphosphate kinase 1 [Terrimonas sp. NA20]|uniref:Polyphosphate kinase n=1 Tax=Terrimonas ginsenosidimutans TaxID=2908004 RepID=A0ABS9KYT4_9BACT|nr:polyphosphate kinase 1 [Terrimonas ginsenosidimutans]MCG2617443.1 polyphosphate kinase 1 [Terrimonas ginsenosidimutans]